MTIEEIKTNNKQAGMHFFTPEPMRFFRSRVGKTVYGERLFITSEQFVSSTRTAKRRYTVRMAIKGGGIRDIGPFNTCTRSAAVRLAVLLAPFAEEMAGEFKKEDGNGTS